MFEIVIYYILETHLIPNFPPNYVDFTTTMLFCNFFVYSHIIIPVQLSNATTWEHYHNFNPYANDVFKITRWYSS